MADFTKNPEFGDFMDATAEVLAHGTTLTNHDLSRIGSLYGYSEGTRHAGGIQERRNFVIAMALRGVGINSETFKNEIIFYDSAVDPAISDLESKKLAISHKRFNASDKTTQTKRTKLEPRIAA